MGGNMPHKIPEKIKATRTALGMTQTVLAKRLGKTTSEISFIENRKRRLTVDAFCAICIVFGVHPADMFRDNHTPFTGGVERAITPSNEN